MTAANIIIMHTMNERKAIIVWISNKEWHPSCFHSCMVECLIYSKSVNYILNWESNVWNKKKPVVGSCQDPTMKVMALLSISSCFYCSIIDNTLHFEF